MTFGKLEILVETWDFMDEEGGELELEWELELELSADVIELEWEPVGPTGRIGIEIAR